MHRATDGFYLDPPCILHGSSMKEVPLPNDSGYSGLALSFGTDPISGFQGGTVKHTSVKTAGCRADPPPLKLHI